MKGLAIVLVIWGLMFYGVSLYVQSLKADMAQLEEEYYRCVDSGENEWYCDIWLETMMGRIQRERLRNTCIKFGFIPWPWCGDSTRDSNHKEDSEA